MLMPLKTYPDPILRRKADSIGPEEIGSEKINELALNLVDTCNVHYGLGLAANQIGAKQSMLVVRPRGVGAENPDPYEGNSDFWVMINPRITAIVSLSNIEKPEMCTWKEGCLSFPEFEINVERLKDINIEWTDLAGTRHSKDISWPLSGVIQHEVEHLQGHNMAQSKKPTVRSIILSDYKRKLRKKEIKAKREARSLRS